MTFPIYPLILPPEWQAARESRGGYGAETHWTERHLQCIWSDSTLRPERLATEGIESVRVEDPGRWNLEAGPDFLDAILLVGPERRRIVGDVEVHIRPGDWRQHRHASDARYDRVVAHVTYFPAGTSAADPGLPPHVLRIALCEALRANPSFSFDAIDLEAYPHAVIPPTPRPCAAALGGDPDRWRELLRAAGQHRLSVKAARLAARLAQRQVPGQVFYEEFMAALGYKQNAQAFRNLARALPLTAWPVDLTAEQHYARLLGVAGLLPVDDGAIDASARPLVRRLWDIWWHYPAERPDPPIVWTLGSLRPANHPARRLAAAAALFGGGCDLLAALRALPRDPPGAWYASVSSLLRTRAALDCWHDRLTLGGRPAARPGALLGAERVGALIANLIVPWLQAEEGGAAALAETLPAEAISAPMRATAARLFGRDHNPALYAREGLLQQGLLQIHADFCLNSREGCRCCRLAATLGGDRKETHASA